MKRKSNLCHALFLVSALLTTLFIETTTANPVTHQHGTHHHDTHHIGNPQHPTWLTAPLDTAPPAPATNPPAVWPATLDVWNADSHKQLTFPLADDEILWGLGPQPRHFQLRGTTLRLTPGQAVPLIISSKGRGVLINSTAPMTFDLGASDPDHWSVQVADRGVEWLTFEGRPDQISRAFRRLQPQPARMPDWLYRPWLGRAPFYSAAEIDAVVRRMQQNQLDVGAVLLDEWAAPMHPYRLDPTRYPAPQTWLRSLRENRIHPIAVLPDSLLTQSDQPDAALASWWHDQAAQLFAMGLSGAVSGRDLRPITTPNDAPPPLHISSLLQPANPRTILQPTWPADGNWPDLHASLRHGLTAGLAGQSFWVHPIGGITQPLPATLYLRWLQWATFSPVFLLHGNQPHEPWLYDDETAAIARFYFQVRARLQRHLQGWGQVATDQAIPIVRPMLWDHADDPVTHQLDDQYLLGPDLLVAPILTTNSQRAVYLPDGHWKDLWTGTIHAGPTWHRVTAPRQQIPLFVRTEMAPVYQRLLAGAPPPDQKPYEITWTAPQIGRTIPPAVLHARRGETLNITYRITNRTAAPMPVIAHLQPAPGLTILPDQIIRLRLPPNSSRPLNFSVTLQTDIAPGTYPLTLRTQISGRDVTAPASRIAVSPAWQMAASQDPTGLDLIDLIDQLVEGDADLSGANWQPLAPTLQQPDGGWDLHGSLRTFNPGPMLLRADLVEERPRRTRFHIGSGNAVSLWLNGRQLYKNGYPRTPLPDTDSVNAVLLPGTNSVIAVLEKDAAPSRWFFRID
jgi:hypothetical protein